MNVLQNHRKDMPVMYREDEIDLAELVARIWKNKLLVIATTFLFTLIAVAYVLIAKPTYELKATFRPVLNSEFSTLNLSGVVEMTPDQAFVQFRRNLVSRELHKQLFDLPGIGDHFLTEHDSFTPDQLYEIFDESIEIVVPVAKKNEVLVSDVNNIKFEHEVPEYGVDVVNRLLQLSNKVSVDELAAEYDKIKNRKILYLEDSIKKNLRIAREVRERRIEALTEKNTLDISNVQDKLDVIREKAKAKRLDRMKRLEEAILISKALKIESPTTYAQYTQKVPSSGTLVNAQVNNQDEPLYLRGTRFLSAELNALKARENDDIDEASIRDLEAELKILKRNREIETLKVREDDRAFIMDQIQPLMDQLESLKIHTVDFGNMKFMRIDSVATVPEKPIKPKKRLIVAIALVLGGMVGIFLALIVSLNWSGVRKATS